MLVKDIIIFMRENPDDSVKYDMLPKNFVFKKVKHKNIFVCHGTLKKNVTSLKLGLSVDQILILTCPNSAIPDKFAG